MSETPYLTSRYPVKIWNELDWYSKNEYSLSEYFDKLEDYKNTDFNNCKLEWILESGDSVVCFNSLAAAYDFNLVFGQDRILVRTRLFDCDNCDKINNWLHEKFGTDSNLDYIFWDGSFDFFDCRTPNWRWRLIRQYKAEIGDNIGEVAEYAFANKKDAFQFKLVWG